MPDRRSLLNDSEEALRLAFDGRLSMLWSAMPAIITKVNLAKMTIECQPAIKGSIEHEDGSIESVNLPVLVDVPVVFPSGGGFSITIPLAVGDEVLVVFGARCIDSWWQSGGVQKPAEARMHDLSDGFAIPGPRSQPNVLPSVSATDLTIRNEAGTQFISLKPNGTISIKASTVNIEGNLVVTGEVTGGLVPVGLSTHVHTGVTTGGGSTGPGVG